MVHGVAGAGAALAGVLRAGDRAAAVDQTPHPSVRGAQVPRQLRGDRGRSKRDTSTNLWGVDVDSIICSEGRVVELFGCLPRGILDPEV